MDNFYENGDTGAVEVQGGLRNLFENNVVDGAGGSGFTFYQGGRQNMGDTVVRYNLVRNVHSRRPDRSGGLRNMRGIEFDTDNDLNTSYAESTVDLPLSEMRSRRSTSRRRALFSHRYRLDNNSVYYNIVLNITHSGLRSKAVSVGQGASGCSWRWDNNLVLDAGTGFEWQHGGSARGGPSSYRHGDCAFNNIFACSPAAGCRENYTHVHGWVAADLENDSDVHANNLYWPAGQLFCSSPGVGCYDNGTESWLNQYTEIAVCIVSRRG